MLPGADKLTLRIIDPSADTRYVEGEWPIHGWEVHSGNSRLCTNIRVYSNGAEPADWDSGDQARIDYCDENSDGIHICDLDAFIEMLLAIRDARDSERSA